ncbi:DMT family transporter [Castellaniella caeni]|uniref:DMT family transporter n=1 Tax=Castellaniella caeni TaxID=266123 RepID=UPI000A4D06E5|nr:EamA family transporter [Castellaniella caeni]
MNTKQTHAAPPANAASSTSTARADAHDVAQRQAARRNERIALLALAGMALGWGYNWVVMKSVLAYVGPFDFSALRTLFGALLLMVVLVLLRRPMRIRAWPRVVLLGVLQTGAFSALIQVALLQGGAGKTSILVYTMPFWVIPMAWVAFGERIRGLQWLALALAALGLVLILEPWTLHADFMSEILAVSAGLCWALATIVAKWIKRDHPMDALPLTAWQMLFGALSLCLAAWIVPERPIDPAPYFYGALLYNAAIATALAWFLWLFALQHLSAGVASMSSLGVPVVGVLAGWLQLGEQPGALELVGMVLIAVALVVVSLRSGGK